ncbi:DUF2753 domain-containing protein [Burkholderia multivorans]|uniref:DUF2753 domain-containing protein n=1 Tax=Burkholderia multivorans TaxID=87883 RepID=UPI001C989FEC|nr:DUF2753 domain-containing protein [Burkholderia multivorans]MBY4673877.1 DUF2753 domain-containing protein [Burkholderia multivorans]
MHQQIATLIPDGLPSRDVSLSLWETVTRQAIATARATGAGSALLSYERALLIARQLLVAPPPGRAEDCVAALVVSHHNLADLHFEYGDVDTAASHLCCAHEALLALILNSDRDISLRQAALRHSRETHLALISHVSTHGPHPLITRALRSGCVAFNVDSPTRH